MNSICEDCKNFYACYNGGWYDECIYNDYANYVSKDDEDDEEEDDEVLNYE